MPFARALHHAVYRDVVIAQFGRWDEREQDDWFINKWNPSMVQIIETGGAAIGCMSIEEREDHLFLVEIELLPRFQGKGIGSQLIASAMRSAADQRRSLRLQVLHKNERARSLYERLGFAVYGKNETHLLMEYREA
jgi:ribosomal protein S18 acetylase RimI-like enzyme